MDNWLHCLNCKVPVNPSQAKIFAGVFCCETCFLAASRLEQRCALELQRLLTLQREAIRVALLEGKVTLGSAGANRELTKREVLQQVLTLQEGLERKRRHEDDQPVVQGVPLGMPAPRVSGSGALGTG